MKCIGVLRKNGEVIVYGGKTHYAFPEELLELSQVLRSDQPAWYRPVPVFDESLKNSVGSIFPHSSFPEVRQLVIFIGQGEFRIRYEDFLRVMQESQVSAQIWDDRRIQVIEGQSTLVEVFS